MKMQGIHLETGDLSLTIHQIRNDLVNLIRLPIIDNLLNSRALDDEQLSTSVFCQVMHREFLGVLA